MSIVVVLDIDGWKKPVQVRDDFFTAILHGQPYRYAVPVRFDVLKSYLDGGTTSEVEQNTIPFYYKGKQTGTFLILEAE